MDHRGRADVVEIVPAGLLGLGVLDRDESEHPVARDDVFDQLDRALLADGERRHGLREDHRVLQRQDGQGCGERQFLGRLLDERVGERFAHEEVTTIEMRSAGAGFGAIGSLMVRNPRS